MLHHCSPAGPRSFGGMEDVAAEGARGVSVQAEGSLHRALDASFLQIIQIISGVHVCVAITSVTDTACT